MNKVQNLQVMALALASISNKLNVLAAKGEPKENCGDLLEVESAMIDMVTREALEIIPQITQ
jgi:hypothetical protein